MSLLATGSTVSGGTHPDRVGDLHFPVTQGDLSPRIPYLHDNAGEWLYIVFHTLNDKQANLS